MSEVKLVRVNSLTGYELIDGKFDPSDFKIKVVKKIPINLRGLWYFRKLTDVELRRIVLHGVFVESGENAYLIPKRKLFIYIP